MPLLWCTVSERALAQGFSFNMEDTKYLCVRRRTRPPGMGVHSVNGQRQEMSQRSYR